MTAASPVGKGARLPIAKATKPGQRLRLIHAGSAEAETARFAATFFVADDGGPIRTIAGDGHRHLTGEEPSQKTGLSNPYDGPTEHALIVDSELRAEVIAYRTQAFRMRLLVGGVVREWICDHLRHIRRDGVDIIETIECKPDLSFLDDDERVVQTTVRKTLARMGWRHRVRYRREVVGGGERQINFGEIYAHQTTDVPEDRLAIFERLCATAPDTTFRELRESLDPNRVKGAAMAHAMICRGRVEFNLDRYLFDPMPVRLLPAVDPAASPIWFREP